MAGARFAYICPILVTLVGCAQEPNLAAAVKKKELFQQAASELPAARQAATEAGLALTPEQLDRIMPREKNGASAFRKAFTMFTSKELFDLRMAEFENGHFQSEKVGPLLAHMSGAIKQIRFAAAYPYCSFGSHGDLSQAESTYKTISQLGNSSQILCIDANYQALEGNMAEAHADLTAGIRIVGHLAEDPTWMNFARALGIEEIIYASAMEIMQDCQGDPSNAASLVAILNQAPGELDYRRMLPSRAAYGYLDVAQELGPEGLKPNPFMDYKPVMDAIDGIPKDVAVAAFRARMLQLEVKIKRGIMKPAKSLLEEYHFLEKIASDDYQGDPTHALNKVNREVELLFPTVMDFVAHRETTLTALRILASHTKGTPWPLSLRSDAPLDVFSDKPLRYKPSPSGFVIYSVGLNGKDDGGGFGHGSDDVAFRYPRRVPKKTGK